MAIEGLSWTKTLLEMGKAVGFAPPDDVTDFIVNLGTPFYSQNGGVFNRPVLIPATVIIEMKVTQELYDTLRKLLSEVEE